MNVRCSDHDLFVGFRWTLAWCLIAVQVTTTGVSEEKLKENGVLLVKTLLDYGVVACVEAILPGPTVTMCPGFDIQSTFSFTS